MIGGLTRLGGFPGLPGRVTLSAGVKICHVNVSLINKNRTVECKYVFMGMILCLIKISNALGLITSKIIKEGCTRLS